MTLTGEFFRWEAGLLVSNADLLEEVKLAAADSWLVENGRVRSLEAHYQRFADWALPQAPAISNTIEAFFEAVTAALPRTGRWFPRIELHIEGCDKDKLPTLYLRLREAPEQLHDIKLFTYPEADPRLKPTVKGPDLSLCMQLRRHAQMHAADETVLTDSKGFITEGALTSIVWFRNGVLEAPDHQTAWIQSITRSEIFEIAKQVGIETREVHAKPADLAGCEVWALSSLQGIRPVTSWLNSEGQNLIELAKPVHFESFSKRLRLLAAPLDKESHLTR
ncbi:MAG: aminotransferase class IV [Micrococcales bacterium]